MAGARTDSGAVPLALPLPPAGTEINEIKYNYRSMALWFMYLHVLYDILSNFIFLNLLQPSLK